MRSTSWSGSAFGLTLAITSMACTGQEPLDHHDPEPAVRPAPNAAEPAPAQQVPPPPLRASPSIFERPTPRIETTRIIKQARRAKTVVLPRAVEKLLDDEPHIAAPVEPLRSLDSHASAGHGADIDVPPPRATRSGPFRSETTPAAEKPSLYQNEIRWTLGVGVAATMLSGIMIGAASTADAPDNTAIALSGVTLGVGVLGMATAGVLTLLDDGPTQPFTIGAGLGYAQMQVAF